MKGGGEFVTVFSRRQWVAHLRRVPRRPARPIVIGATSTRVQVPSRSLGTSRRAPAPRTWGTIRACNRADGGISDWTRPVDSERWHERGSLAAIGTRAQGSGSSSLHPSIGGARLAGPQGTGYRRHPRLRAPAVVFHNHPPSRPRRDPRVSAGPSGRVSGLLNPGHDFALRTSLSGRHPALAAALVGEPASPCVRDPQWHQPQPCSLHAVTIRLDVSIGGGGLWHNRYKDMTRASTPVADG